MSIHVAEPIVEPKESVIFAFIELPVRIIWIDREGRIQKEDVIESEWAKNNRFGVEKDIA